MNLIEIAGMLLIVMMLFLAGGVWIAMTLAIVGWIGMSFFTGTPPGKNLFTAFWGSNASWTLEQLAGRRNTRVDALRPLAEGVVRRLRP